MICALKLKVCVCVCVYFMVETLGFNFLARLGYYYFWTAQTTETSCARLFTIKLWRYTHTYTQDMPARNSGGLFLSLEMWYRELKRPGRPRSGVDAARHLTPPSRKTRQNYQRKEKRGKKKKKNIKFIEINSCTRTQSLQISFGEEKIVEFKCQVKTIFSF